MKKYVKVVSLILLGLVLLGVGITYAFFNYKKTGQNNKVIAGSLYLTMNEGQDTINLSNILPETKEEARARNDNTLTFTLKGKNTSTTKDINYEILLDNGTANNDNTKSRIVAKDLVFDLVEIGANNEETYILDAVSYDTLVNQKIWVDSISKNTTAEVQKTYRLRMWVSNDVIISDSDPNRDYTTTEYKNLYASVKVAVEGDLEEKEIPLVVNISNTLSVNNGNEIINEISNINSENSEDDYTLTITSSNNNVEFVYNTSSAEISPIANENISGRVSYLDDEELGQIRKITGEVIVSNSFEKTYTIPNNNKATVTFTLRSKTANEEVTDLHYTLTKGATVIQDFVRHVTVSGYAKNVPSIQIVNKEATYTGSAITLDSVTIKNSDNTAYTGTIKYTYYKGTNCSDNEIASAPVDAGEYSVRIYAAGSGSDGSTSSCGTITINKKALTTNIDSCSNKTYDGTDSASCTYSAVSEKVGSDVVSLTGGSCKFNNANVGTGKTVTCSSIGLTGANSGNYTLSTTSATKTANIIALTLTASLSSCGKTYNGNVTAPCTVTYTNVQTGDSVTGTATCTYANKTVGTGKTVTCSSFTKTGTGNGNYAVPADGQTTTANITALALTAGTPSCNNKTYDGNTNASCTVNYTNVVDGDTVNADATCTFADADVGTGKTVTCSSFTKSGTDNGNYTVPSGNKTTTANITAQKCNTPTNISISSAGAVTWTASSNCSTGSHQVKVESGSYATANSGVNKKSDIIAGTGTRTVYVKALAPNTNYSDSDAGTGTTTVYSVTLTKGTGISDVTGAGNYITGSTVTLGATASTGYTWSKWTETSGGAQVSTTNAYSATINSTSGNWAYTANATINSYTVTYNYSANGGTSATKTTDTKNYNAAIDLTPTATKSGWTFVGWNTSQSATTGLSSLTMGTSNVTLYAIYRKEAITRKMTLYKNGNTSFTYNGTTYTDTSKSFDICTIPAVYNTATQDASCSATITMATIAAPSNTPTLIGWSTGADNHTATYTSGQTNVSLTMDADKSFYAQTTKAAVDGTVTFNPNGNTKFTYSSTDYTSTTAIKICDIAATYNGVAQASTCTATVTMPTITANGNTPTVIGWSTGVDTHTATYTSGQTNVTLTSGTTYYAQSQNSPSQYTITFNVNGNSGSNSSQSCTPATSYNGAAASTQCSITSPAISAHANTPTVLGWTSTADDHTTGWAPQTARNISASGTYYAQTKSTDVTYSVTYNNDGATSGGASNTSCSPASTYNGTAPNTTCSITLASAPEKTSFIFNGWKSSTTNETYNAGTSYTVTANTTLTAQWTQPWAENLSYTDTYGIGCSDAQCALDYVAGV